MVAIALNGGYAQRIQCVFFACEGRASLCYNTLLREWEREGFQVNSSNLRQLIKTLGIHFSGVGNTKIAIYVQVWAHHSHGSCGKPMDFPVPLWL